MPFEMPEYVLPRNASEGSRELALYYTFVISIDFQVDAVKLWGRARRLFEERPEAFEPQVVLGMRSW